MTDVVAGDPTKGGSPSDRNLERRRALPLLLTSSVLAVAPFLVWDSPRKGWVETLPEPAFRVTLALGALIFGAVAVSMVIWCAPRWTSDRNQTMVRFAPEVLTVRLPFRTIRIPRDEIAAVRVVPSRSRFARWLGYTAAVVVDRNAGRPREYRGSTAARRTILRATSVVGGPSGRRATSVRRQLIVRLCYVPPIGGLAGPARTTADARDFQFGVAPPVNTRQSVAAADKNEIGTAPPRGRPTVDADEANGFLTHLAGEDVRLTERVHVHGSPATCPACGSDAVIWGCDEHIKHARESIHPLVWHETEWMADTFICGTCDAGWIEPDEPEAITWVRPYWRVEPET